jgi:Uma2 family endonuclease
MGVSEETYKRVALEDDEGIWELVCGRLRKKPPMTFAHTDLKSLVAFELQSQLPLDQFRVHVDGARLRVPGGQYFVPDIAVVPAELVIPHLQEDSVLEVIDEQVPLVVEIWPRSTGDYDVLTKIPEYQRRGDREIWLVHPYDKTVRIWRRAGDGSYAEELRADGTIAASAMPVQVKLSAIFRDNR